MKNKEVYILLECDVDDVEIVCISRSKKIVERAKQDAEKIRDSGTCEYWIEEHRFDMLLLHSPI